MDAAEIEHSRTDAREGEAFGKIRSWDSRPSFEASLADLLLDLFAVTYRRSAWPREIEKDDRPLEEQLATLRFFDLEAEAPTNAGVLLFGRAPSYFYPGAYVQYVRYAGASRADEVLEDRRLTGDLLSILRGLDQLARDIEVGSQRARIPLSESKPRGYPAEALRELFVNAIVHREYVGISAPVMINHYADSLEILNPGGLFRGQSAAQVPTDGEYRNPILADAVRVLGWANLAGRGLAGARTALLRNGFLEPELPSTQSSYFSVRIRRQP